MAVRLHKRGYAMQILEAINNTAFSIWLRESSSLFAYPMFILAHTIGLAIVVGLSSILALLILGSAPRAVLAATRPVFPFLWAGFVINAMSGLVLIIADAPTMATNRVMWIKFGFIIPAVVIMRRVQRLVVAAGDTQTVPAAAARVNSGKLLAAGALACWLGAIITGRLTAYFGPVAGLLGE